MYILKYQYWYHIFHINKYFLIIKKTYKYNFDGRNTPAITSTKDTAPAPAQQTTAQLDALKGRGPVQF